MLRSHTYFLAFALLGSSVAACSDDSITQPTSSTEPSASQPVEGPALAAAATLGQWVTEADMFSSGRSFLATAMVPNAAGESILYAMGGKEADGSILGRVLAYNVATNKWMWKNDMPSSVAYPNTAAVINGKIYITGGLVSPVSFNYGLYVYDPATSTWTTKKSPPNTSLEGVSGVINNKLYVATSCEQEDCDPAMGYFFWRYDPATDQWAPLPSPPFFPRTGGTIGGRLYLASGNKVGIYDPASNQWTVKTTAVDVGSPYASATQTAKLYVFGSATFVYDPTTNAWTKLASPPKSMFGRAASHVRLNNQVRIELVGGDRPGNNLAFIP